MAPPVTAAPPRDAAATGLHRLLAAMPDGQPVGASLADHLCVHGQLPPRGARLIDEIGAAGLTGRGGAAFPAARKISAVRAAGRGAVAVANGAEGEPASRKDVALLWLAPHLVLDGLRAAAEACGARTAILYVHAGQPALLGRLQHSLAERELRGVEVIEAPARFLAGEETALVARVGGGAAVPGYKEHRVFERGIGGRPTLVQNVETLAHIGLIARHGAGWFRRAGTPAEPGSALATLHEADGSWRVAEVALGTPISQLLRLDDRVQAVLAGGYHGGWLSAGQARGLRLSNADLRPAGSFVGAGVLAALPADVCGLAEVANVARYLALESAGQCGPCLNGLPRIAAALTAVARPLPAPAELADLRRWSGLVTGRGACHHPDGTVRFVTSALRVFAAEIAGHARGRCTATAAGPFLPMAAVPAAEPDWR
jgi:NADH:ubiquinone oxidoreductase subunit F (NADH-binding)